MASSKQQMFIYWWAMDFTEGTAQEILERLSSAYGVTTQKSLAESLGVSAANVSNWLQRNSVPGSAFVKCALDTGCDLAWLTSGKLANARNHDFTTIQTGKELHDRILASGGRVVLRRIMDAYGFKTQKELGDHLSISSGTISTWIRRDYFPGDVVITCALDTGVSLEWLAIGKTVLSNQNVAPEFENIRALQYFNNKSGQLIECGKWIVDASLLKCLSEKCALVEKDSEAWIVDFDFKNISNGRWLINIDGSHDVYDVLKIPGNKLKLTNKGHDFECGVTEVECVGQVKKTIISN